MGRAVETPVRPLHEAAQRMRSVRSVEVVERRQSTARRNLEDRAEVAGAPIRSCAVVVAIRALGESVLGIGPIGAGEAVQQSEGTAWCQLKDDTGVARAS